MQERSRPNTWRYIPRRIPIPYKSEAALLLPFCRRRFEGSEDVVTVWKAIGRKARNVAIPRAVSLLLHPHRIWASFLECYYCFRDERVLIVRNGRRRADMRQFNLDNVWNRSHAIHTLDGDKKEKPSFSLVAERPQSGELQPPLQAFRELRGVYFIAMPSRICERLCVKPVAWYCAVEKRENRAGLIIREEAEQCRLNAGRCVGNIDQSLPHAWRLCIGLLISAAIASLGGLCSKLENNYNAIGS